MALSTTTRQLLSLAAWASQFFFCLFCFVFFTPSINIIALWGGFEVAPHNTHHAPSLRHIETNKLAVLEQIDAPDLFCVFCRGNEEKKWFGLHLREAEQQKEEQWLPWQQQEVLFPPPLTCPPPIGPLSYSRSSVSLAREETSKRTNLLTGGATDRSTITQKKWNTEGFNDHNWIPDWQYKCKAIFHPSAHSSTAAREKTLHGSKGIFPH